MFQDVRPGAVFKTGAFGIEMLGGCTVERPRGRDRKPDAPLP